MFVCCVYVVINIHQCTRRSQVNETKYRRAEKEKAEALAKAKKATKDLKRKKRQHALQQSRHKAKETSVQQMKREANKALAGRQLMEAENDRLQETIVLLRQELQAKQVCVCVHVYVCTIQLTLTLPTSYTKQDMLEAKDTETQSAMANASRLEFERDQFIDKWKNMQAKNADLQVSIMCVSVFAPIQLTLTLPTQNRTCSKQKTRRHSQSWPRQAGSNSSVTSSLTNGRICKLKMQTCR